MILLEVLRRHRVLLSRVALVLVIVWPIASQWRRDVNKPLSHVDEAAWIFQTNYYHLLFEQHDIRHPDWQDPLVYHHPPLTRYLFGAALSINGFQARSLDNFRWWTEHDLDYEETYWQPFWDELSERVPPQALMTTRTVSALFALLACAALYLLGKEMAPRIGVASAVLLAWDPLLRSTAGLGLGETVLLFFLIMSVWQGIWLCRKLSDFSPGQGGLVLPLVAWAVTSALAFSSKINGLLGWFVGVLCLTLTLAFGRDKKNRLVCLGVLLGGTALFLGVTILLNPTLYPHPLANLCRYFSFRMEQIALQREYGFFNVFQNWHDRLAYFVRQIFFDQDFFFTHTKLPLGLIFFLAGMFALAGDLGKGGRAKQFVPSIGLLLGLVVMGIATAWTFFMNWARYLLPLFPWIMMVEAVGAFWALSALWETRQDGRDGWRQWIEDIRSKKKRWGVIGVTTLVLTAFCLGPLFPPPTPYAKEEKDFLLLVSTLQRHPHNKMLRVQLAVAYQVLGETNEAEKQWDRIAAPDPNEEFPPRSESLENFFRKAEALFPKEKRLFAQVARYWEHHHQTNPAQKQWQEVLRLDPDDLEAQQELARITAH